MSDPMSAFARRLAGPDGDWVADTFVRTISDQALEVLARHATRHRNHRERLREETRATHPLTPDCFDCGKVLQSGVGTIIDRHELDCPTLYAWIARNRYNSSGSIRWLVEEWAKRCAAAGVAV
jgi:hypothetical protein